MCVLHILFFRLSYVLTVLSHIVHDPLLRVNEVEVLGSIFGEVNDTEID